jgi:hypothetical protein
MAVMRKIFLIIFALSVSSVQGIETIEGYFVRKREDLFIINLPYKVEDNIAYVFDEDTPYAIDIIELRADGEKLQYNNDFEAGSFNSRRYFHTKGTEKGKREYFIIMDWYAVYPFPSMALQWNDGRYLMFNNRIPQENTYVVTNGMKILEITYRIVLPYPLLTIDNLYDLNYEHKIFTEEYHMIVKLNDIFPILKEIK